MKILVGGLGSMESAWAGNPNVSGGLVDGSRLFILRGFAKCRWFGEDKQVNCLMMMMMELETRRSETCL